MTDMTKPRCRVVYRDIQIDAGLSEYPDASTLHALKEKA